ncbi:hypothetical protein BBJ28_00007469 [Nothophytophthora sp. Chile5]|nr:hypothetical protein BBJ28_00007469 [Nothophytophthora sp. Chile5]
MLQDLSRCEERSNLQSVERASVRTQQRLLRDQLLQVQEELVTAQASKAKLCEEIGALQQTKEHQAKQLANFGVELQASREAQAVMTKKMEGLEESTWKVKQQYIRFALDDGHMPSAESADSNTRGRAEGNEAAPHHAVQADSKPLPTAKGTDETMEESAESSPESIGCTERCLHSEKKAAAQIIVQRDAHIEELAQKLDSSLSKQQADKESPPTFSGIDQDSSKSEGRLKILEENLAQMNGYADQLELVIAQCPTCTIKLQHENTQDAADKAG